MIDCRRSTTLSSYSIFQNVINFLCSNGSVFDLSEPTFFNMLSCEKAEQLSQTISHVLEGLRSAAEKANESLITRLVESLIEREQSYDEPGVADRPEVPVKSSQPNSPEDSSNGGQRIKKTPGSTKKSSTRRPSKAPKTKQRQPGKLAHVHKKCDMEDETSDSSSGGEKPNKRPTTQPASSADTDHSASSKSGKVEVTPPSSAACGSSTNSHLDSRFTESVSASGGSSEASSQRHSEKLNPKINKGHLEERASTGEMSFLSEYKESPKEAKTDSRQSKQSFKADDSLASKKSGKSQVKPPILPPASADESSAGQSHSESASLDWSNVLAKSLDFDSRHKLQLKKETELNFSLVLEENLPPESMAKINQMLEYLSHSHPEVRVSLSKSSTDQLPDLVIVCGSDHTFFRTNLLYSDRVPILCLKAGNSQSGSLEFSLDDFAPEEVFDAIFSGDMLVVPMHRLICCWTSTNGPQQVCSINDREQGVQLQPGTTVKVSMTKSLEIKRPNSS